MARFTNASIIEKAEKALDVGWDGNLPVNIQAMAENLRFPHPLYVSALPITCVADDLGRLSNRVDLSCNKDGERFYRIAYNGNEETVRQRFAIAQGLGHILLSHFPDQGGITIENETFHLDTPDDESREATYFAVEVLMPQRYVSHVAKNSLTIQQLADFFGVSPTTIRHRLHQIGLLYGPVGDASQ